ncbi:5-dehydro-2-deoxygluconokinase [soil metagenome]
MTGLELLTVGRVSVDLYADTAGASFVDPQRFVKSIGGTATNVAVAAAMLGHRAGVLTKVGADPFGDYVIEKLTSFGVDTSWVGRHPDLRTPLAFAAMTPPEDPELIFYREPHAPDMQLVPADVDDTTVAAVSVLWVAGSAMAEEPARGTIEAMLTLRSRAAHTVLDLDFRPALWTSETEATDVIGAAIDGATVAIGNRTECRVALGTDDPDDAADALLRRGVGMAIVKMGGEGVLVATGEERAVIAPQAVDVVCGLGAGDAFGGAAVHGLLSGWPPRRVVEYANAAGAIVAGRLLCADAMPTDDEVTELLAPNSAPDVGD